MKSLRFLITGLIAFPVLVVGAAGRLQSEGGNVSWVTHPTQLTGFYFMYDDAEADQPFDEPLLPLMPTDYSEYTIHDTSASEQLPIYNDKAYSYNLPDSFWYFGYWLEPGDVVYVSPDGWISFDEIPENGFPNPPSTTPPFPNTANPNGVIAPLWADFDPTRTPGNIENNRVYLMYNEYTKALIAEWYMIQSHASGNEYTFLATLQLGGQALLQQYLGCGVVFSSHFIHFMYNTSSAGWTADNGAIGLEDPDGTKGITYTGVVNTSEDNMHVIRVGYKRTFTNDVAAYGFLAPGHIVLRYTPTEPKVIVANVGEETEHFVVTLRMISGGGTGTVVYDHNLGSYNLLPGAKDTLTAPCWIPQEMGESYQMQLSVTLDRDSCADNDILREYTTVACVDTAYYQPDFDFSSGMPFNNDFQLASFYGCENGLLITGGEVRSQSVTWVGAVWEAQNGCGLPQDPPLAMAIPEKKNSVWSTFNFKGGGVYANAANPGNVWVGVIPSSSNDPATLGVWPSWPSMWPALPDNPCFAGSLRKSTVYRSYGAWDWPGPSQHPMIIGAYLHLGFGPPPLSPLPSPPCYDDKPHDVTCYEVKEPHVNYVEAGQTITPELGIANLGLIAEPTHHTYFPVEFFAVIPDSLEPDTVFVDSTVVTNIGFLGDEEDDPDTVIVAISSWTPEGKCSWNNPILQYELTGLVRLGEVGPDSSDHCPDNDTVRRLIQSLWSHDVGVTDVTLSPGPSASPDWYDSGTDVTITATVENYGFNEEHNIPVRCEIVDKGSGADTLVWHALEELEFLDWRGNTLDRPYLVELVFPVWTTPSQNHFTIECRSELVDDNCPDDDARVIHINSGVEESPSELAYSLEISASNPFGGSATIYYTLASSVGVSLKLYDVSGKLITTLVEGSRVAGRHSVSWNGCDKQGRKVAAGIYLVRMEADKFSDTKKVVIY